MFYHEMLCLSPVKDPVGTVGQFAEVASRHKVSGVLQKLLLLLRSARCCHPAAQWYISHLRRARHLLHKVLFHGLKGVYLVLQED